jgi:hypothetical protein
LYGLTSTSPCVFPWYAPPTTTTPRPPLFARAKRSASSFASLPELTKKHTESGSGSVAASRSA